MRIRVNMWPDVKMREDRMAPKAQVHRERRMNENIGQKKRAITPKPTIDAVDVIIRV